MSDQTVQQEALALRAKLLGTLGPARMRHFHKNAVAVSIHPTDASQLETAFYEVRDPNDRTMLLMYRAASAVLNAVKHNFAERLPADDKASEQETRDLALETFVEVSRKTFPTDIATLFVKGVAGDAASADLFVRALASASAQVAAIRHLRSNNAAQ